MEQQSEYLLEIVLRSHRRWITVLIGAVLALVGLNILMVLALLWR